MPFWKGYYCSSPFLTKVNRDFNLWSTIAISWWKVTYSDILRLLVWTWSWVFTNSTGVMIMLLKLVSSFFWLPCRWKQSILYNLYNIDKNKWKVVRKRTKRVWNIPVLHQPLHRKQNILLGRISRVIFGGQIHVDYFSPLFDHILVIWPRGFDPFYQMLLRKRLLPRTNMHSLLPCYTQAVKRLDKAHAVLLSP